MTNSSSRPEGDAEMSVDIDSAAESFDVDDYTDQLISEDEGGSAEATVLDGLRDEDSAVYTPPIDPVLDDQGGVLGGFGSGAQESVQVAPSGDDELGDEAIAQAVRRELREDAATSELAIHVSVQGGVARLRGSVPDLVDAENAEAVASRVPGVKEVNEELDAVTNGF